MLSQKVCWPPPEAQKVNLAGLPAGTATAPPPVVAVVAPVEVTAVVVVVAPVEVTAVVAVVALVEVTAVVAAAPPLWLLAGAVAFAPVVPFEPALGAHDAMTRAKNRNRTRLFFICTTPYRVVTVFSWE
jgi:hypothetical protein